MPWNEPGNNQDKKNGWNNSSGNPPDLEQAIRQFYKKLMGGFGKKMGNTGITPPSSFKVNSTILGSIFLIIFVIWFLAGIVIIDPAEEGVVLRFGKFVGTLQPGPHWVPSIIDTVSVVNEQQISTYSYSAEMLTKDQNIVSVALAVQYRIANPKDYLFNVVNPEESLKQATASALRQVIGQTNLDQVLTSGRELIRQQVEIRLNDILDKYQTGLLVTDIAMQPAKAPEEVKDAFDDAIKAQEDEQRFENQAQAYAMQVEPFAKGNAQRLLADAKAYQQQVVFTAQGDTAQFLALLPQYENTPSIIRERLYLETMENILQNSRKIFVDSTSNNNMFYFPLDKLIQDSQKISSPITPLISNTTTASNNTPTPLISSTPPTSSTTNSDDRMQGGY